MHPGAASSRLSTSPTVYTLMCPPRHERQPCDGATQKQQDNNRGGRTTRRINYTPPPYQMNPRHWNVQLKTPMSQFSFAHLARFLDPPPNQMQTIVQNACSDSSSAQMSSPAWSKSRSLRYKRYLLSEAKHIAVHMASLRWIAGATLHHLAIPGLSVPGV